MQDRTFTVEEANERLPMLRDLLPRIRVARRDLLRAGERVRGVADRNGGGAEGATYLRSMEILKEGIEALTKEGIILRDAESGLVDFPSRREDRDVYLCWRLEEEAVGHWHEVNAGMAGRRPL